MKWHDWKPTWRSMAAGLGLTNDFERLAAGFPDALNRAKRDGQRAFTSLMNSVAHMTGEHWWEQAGRPYYDVYPSVAEALSVVDLSKVLSDHIHLPLPQLLIRFQQGHELQAESGVSIRSILALESVKADDITQRGIVIAVDVGGPPRGIWSSGLILRPGDSIATILERGENRGLSDPRMLALAKACQLICTLCMLRDNPDIITPEPLEADRRKWDATHDVKLIERAARRGKRAWAIGRDIQVAPGFRRPHFAIRWMGHAAEKTPVVRPIKGCLVNRKRIEEIPTGYLDIQLVEQEQQQ